MKVVYVGDCGVDDYSGKLYPGGCGLNVVYYSNQAGLKIDLVSCVGNDENGNIPLDIVKKMELDVSHIHRLNGVTPKQLIRILPDGEKKFISYDPGVISGFRLNREDIKFIKEHDILLTIYYSQIRHLFNEVVGINFSGTKIIDFMDGKDFKKDINFVKKYADWWDIGFFGLSFTDKIFINDLILLAKNKKKKIVITLGSVGSLVIWENKIFRQKMKPLKVVDTTGCGDAYLGGFLAEWFKSRNIRPAMTIGKELADKCASHLGSIEP